MSPFSKVWLLAIAATAAPPVAQAVSFGFGVGLEAGGAESHGTSLAPGATTTTAITGTLGLILEERLAVSRLELTLWEDTQLPLAIQTGGYLDATGQGVYSTGEEVPSNYQPLDIGLRLGLERGLLRPYLGVLVSDSIFSQTAPNSGELRPNFWSVGGDLGLDFAFSLVRLGVELRADDSTSPLFPTWPIRAPEHAFLAEALFSARLSL